MPLVAAVIVFVAAITGIAVVGGGEDDGRLPKLPLASPAGEATADMMLAPAHDIEYRLGDLGDVPEEGDAFRLPQADVEDRVSALADALGIDGDATAGRDGWVVEDGDKALRVERSGGSPWSYSSESPDRAVSSSSIGCVMPECPPDMACTQTCPEPERPDGMLTPGQSVVVARRVMSAAGARLTDAVERVEDGGAAWQVQFDPAVDGLATTGFTHSVAVGPKGEIQSANGWLGQPKHIGRYPLVSAADAVRRLKSGFGIGPMPVGGREPAVGRIDTAPPQPAAKVVRTLTAVRVGLTLVPSHDVDHAAHLVPTFLFKYSDDPSTDSVADAELPVIAVSDEYLDTVEPGRGDTDGGRRSSTGSCSGSASASDTDGGNQPMTVTVCVEPATAKVGEKVDFTVTASDPDAPVSEEQCFGEPESSFGDESPHSVCMPSCGVPPGGGSSQKYAPEPGELTKTYVHSYDKPGTYTATFTYTSGSVCDRGNPYASTGSGSATVTVVKR